jgi:hypothetical protein
MSTRSSSSTTALATAAGVGLSLAALGKAVQAHPCY